jgi:hypothetical protein
VQEDAGAIDLGLELLAVTVAAALVLLDLEEAVVQHWQQGEGQSDEEAGEKRCADSRLDDMCALGGEDPDADRGDGCLVDLTRNEGEKDQQVLVRPVQDQGLIDKTVGLV